MLPKILDRTAFVDELLGIPHSLLIKNNMNEQFLLPYLTQVSKHLSLKYGRETLIYK